MLTTTCWFLYGPMVTPWDKRVYLHRADAQQALDRICKQDPGTGSMLALKELPLVLASSGDQRLAPEAVFAPDQEVHPDHVSAPRLPEPEEEPEPEVVEAAPEPTREPTPISEHIDYDSFLDFR